VYKTPTVSTADTKKRVSLLETLLKLQLLLQQVFHDDFAVEDMPFWPPLLESAVASNLPVVAVVVVVAIVLVYITCFHCTGSGSAKHM
jgi:hypothetical protein